MNSNVIVCCSQPDGVQGFNMRSSMYRQQQSAVLHAFFSSVALLHKGFLET